MSMRHRTEGVAQEQLVCVCVFGERDQNQLKEESRPSVTDLRPERGKNRGKAPVTYRAVEADKD